jgi:hypothetical protein
MMSRFAAGLSKLKEVSGKASPEPDSAEWSATTSKDVAPSRRGKVTIAAYFDPAVRKQLAILAVEEDKSQAALMADALNMLFERYGKPPIARA